MKYPTIDELFGSLYKPRQADKCTAARKEENPLPCQFAKLGNLVYCTVHKGLKL